MKAVLSSIFVGLSARSASEITVFSSQKCQMNTTKDHWLLLSLLSPVGCLAAAKCLLIRRVLHRLCRIFYSSILILRDIYTVWNKFCSSSLPLFLFLVNEERRQIPLQDWDLYRVQGEVSTLEKDGLKDNN